jgi:hypothetical protein
MRGSLAGVQAVLTLRAELLKRGVADTALLGDSAPNAAALGGAAIRVLNC